MGPPLAAVPQGRGLKPFFEAASDRLTLLHLEHGKPVMNESTRPKREPGLRIVRADQFDTDGFIGPERRRGFGDETEGPCVVDHHRIVEPPKLFGCERCFDVVLGQRVLLRVDDVGCAILPSKTRRRHA
jgi:hypothetical protein